MIYYLIRVSIRVTMLHKNRECILYALRLVNVRAGDTRVCAYCAAKVSRDLYTWGLPFELNHFIQGSPDQCVFVFCIPI